MQTLTRILALLALVSLAACGGSTAAGTYKLDSAETQKANEAMKTSMLAGMPEAQQEMMGKMFDDMFAKMDISMTLAEDGTVTGNMSMPNPVTQQTAEETMTGTWSEDGDKVTMMTKTASSGKEETVIATLAGDTLTATMSEAGQEMTLVLQRN